ncbi:deoxyribodipyrimidine photo-lyase [bacterium]|nr:deoxyribodipyrimidine photo-lyase [bacterium]
MIHPERIKILNKNPVRDEKYLLYWMQAAQREEYNHALEYAVELANQRNKPLLVFFGITDQFPEANLRHYSFMLEGLREVQKALQNRGIRLAVQLISPTEGILNLISQADLLVVDRGYLRVQKDWRSYVAQRIPCSMIEVETEVIVPVQSVSSKEEYAAATIRKKLQRQLNEHLKPLDKASLTRSSLDFDLVSTDLNSPNQTLNRLKINQEVTPSPIFKGGTSRAKELLDQFIEHKLDHFDNMRNDPTKDYCSNLSPYLHFGQISPLYVALRCADLLSPGKEAFLEELIIRRELSMNFVNYNRFYDSYGCLPQWALNTLEEHRTDPREYIYSLSQLEHAQTHDPYWNAAQTQMTIIGKMHGYMRMYWGKKILEWTESPRQAYEITLYLNNKYELDGRDPNGFAGVAWCFGKHDRPWKERPVFGNVRYMNANGLKRKFDIDAYVNRIAELKNKS